MAIKARFPSMIRQATLIKIACTSIALSLSSLSYGVEGKRNNLTPLWSVSGFKMPESVVYDQKSQRFYVSNVNGAPLHQDSNGSIGWISDSGDHALTEWVTGLHSPKGLALDESYLYVADVKELVVINTSTGLISARYLAPESSVLNGVAITENKEVYVSDWAGNALYKLVGNELVKWLDNEALESPNGLFAKGNYLYVASWGRDIQDDFSTKTSGGLKRVNLEDQSIEHLSKDSQWMNLDGIDLLPGNKVLATDFMKGELLEISAAGGISQRHNLEPSAADFYYSPEKQLLLVPYLMTNSVKAYQFKP